MKTEEKRMNENRDVHEDKKGSPERPAVPRTYRLGDRGANPFLDFFMFLAQFSLVFAQVISVFSCVAILVFGGYQLCMGTLRHHGMLILIGTPVAFLYQFAMLVVFIRVAKANPR